MDPISLRLSDQNSFKKLKQIIKTHNSNYEDLIKNSKTKKRFIMFPFQREFGMKHNRQHLKISDDWFLNRNLYNKDTMDSWANFLHFQFK